MDTPQVSSSRGAATFWAAIAAMLAHPIHLHGMPQQVIAKDGYPLTQPYLADTVVIAPGERIDVIIEATEPGAWAWHCHILNHAEGAAGMFGMVTALVVH